MATAETDPLHPDVRQREEYLAAGLLRGDRTADGRLAIYTYTDQCTYASAWDEITIHSRGHIFDLRTGECVAWPFPKFFNLGENARSLSECFPWNQPYEIYEKMDGWLGVLYRHENKFKVATRGSFQSSGALWGTAHLQAFDLSCLPEAATLCFEIINPAQRIILDYQGRETLMILAAFDRFTRAEYPRSMVVQWSRAIGLPVVPQLDPMSLEELLKNQQEREHFEGFVIRFHDGQRVKVKTQWYLRIAKIVTGLTPIAVWEVMAAGKVQESYLALIPEEVRPLAENYREVLEGQYARTLLDIDRRVEPILQRFGTDRKALARYLEEHRQELGDIRPAVFLLLDGKRDRLEKFIMDRIYPKGNQFVSEAAPQSPIV